METLLQDLRYTFRALRRSPGFALVAVLTLALGIGANTAIFSVINAVLLRPPAQVDAPGRLVALFTSDYSGPPYGTSSYPDYEEFRAQTEVFEGVLAYTPRGIGIGEGDDLLRTGMEVVSDNYFQVLGVRPALGRAFLPEEGRAQGAQAVAVISYDLWQRSFAGDPGVIGGEVLLGGQPFTIVGVAPEGFAGLVRGFGADVWVPVTAPRLGLGSETLTARGNRGLFLLGRLRPGVTRELAQAAMEVVARRLHAAYPDAWTDLHQQGRRITLLPESAARVPPQIRGPVLGVLGLLMATVGIVLLICCANLSGLLLARASRRAREIAIRLSLGASRRRVVRQLLTESVVLSLLGAVAGVLLAVWTTSLLLAFQLPIPVRIALDLQPDARVLAFAGAVALLAALLAGLAPALRATRADLTTTLKSETPAVTVGRRRLSLRSALVVGQVALSLVLLVGALLFLRSLQRAAAIDPGFRTEEMLLVYLEPPADGEEAESPAAVAHRVQQRLAGQPGVAAVSWAYYVPLGLEWGRRGMSVEGYEAGTGEDMEFPFTVVGPDYFRTMEIPLVRGRGLTEEDRAGAPGAVVVNESFARRFWPGEEPLGRRISVSGPAGPFLEVVGVARDGRYRSLTEEPVPYVYFPSLQEPDWSATLLVRTRGEPRALLEVVRRETEVAAPGWSLVNVRTLEEHVGTSLLPQRVAGGVLGLFGVLALLLAAVGMYGVVAFAVAQRTREIGIRIALGADARDVLGLIVRQGLALVGVGIGLGLIAAWGVTRLLASLLLGLSTTDPLSFLGAPLLLTLVALLASYLPARRATRVDPMIALRAE